MAKTQPKAHFQRAAGGKWRSPVTPTIQARPTNKASASAESISGEATNGKLRTCSSLLKPKPRKSYCSATSVSFGIGEGVIHEGNLRTGSRPCKPVQLAKAVCARLTAYSAQRIDHPGVSLSAKHDGNLVGIRLLIAALVSEGEQAAA